MIIFSSREAGWVFVLGMAAGGGCGVLLGRWLTLLTLRNPLGLLFRAYGELWRDLLGTAASGRDVVGRVNARAVRR